MRPRQRTRLPESSSLIFELLPSDLVHRAVLERSHCHHCIALLSSIRIGPEQAEEGRSGPNATESSENSG